MCEPRFMQSCLVMNENEKENSYKVVKTVFYIAFVVHYRC